MKDAECAGTNEKSFVPETISIDARLFSPGLF